MASKCEIRSEFHSGSGHHGRSKTVKVELDWQPPGHGAFTLPVEIRVCEGHAWLLGQHMSAFRRAER